MSKRVLNKFWGYFFRKFFFAQSSVPGRVVEMFLINKKIFKIPKMPKIIPKIVQLCFEHVLGVLFSKIFFLPIVPWRVEFSKCFQKVFKNPKMPKIVPKSVQLCFEHVLGVLFSKNFFCPVFHGGSRLRNVFKKSKKFQISKKAQNRSQKCPNVFWTYFWVIFL